LLLGAIENLEKASHFLDMAYLDFWVLPSAVFAERKTPVDSAIPVNPVLMRLMLDECAGCAFIEHVLDFLERYEPGRSHPV
jgi:hypothetical protein